MKTEQFKASYPLPGDFYELDRHPVARDPETHIDYMMMRIDAGEMGAMKKSRDRADVVGRPIYYSVGNGFLHLHPAPDLEYEVIVTYLSTPKVW